MERPEFLIDAPTEALIRQAHEQRHAEYTDLIERLTSLGVTVRLADIARPVALEGILLDHCPFHLRGEGDTVTLFIWEAGAHPGATTIDPATGEEHHALHLDSATWRYAREHTDAGHIRAGDMQSAFSALLAQHREAVR